MKKFDIDEYKKYLIRLRSDAADNMDFFKDNGNVRQEDYWRGQYDGLGLAYSYSDVFEQVFSVDPFSKCYQTDEPCIPGTPCVLNENEICVRDCSDYIHLSEENPFDDR